MVYIILALVEVNLQPTYSVRHDDKVMSTYCAFMNESDDEHVEDKFCPPSKHVIDYSSIRIIRIPHGIHGKNTNSTTMEQMTILHN